MTAHFCATFSSDVRLISGSVPSFSGPFAPILMMPPIPASIRFRVQTVRDKLIYNYGSSLRDADSAHSPDLLCLSGPVFRIILISETFITEMVDALMMRDIPDLCPTLHRSYVQVTEGLWILHRARPISRSSSGSRASGTAFSWLSLNG